MAKPITVLFDANPMVAGNKSGVGLYTYYLIEALAKKYPDKVRLVGHYFNFLGRKQPQLPKNTNIRYKQSRFMPGKLLSLSRRLGFQIPFEVLIKSSGDIALFPNFVSLPTIQKIKKITVVHDLAFEKYPQYLQRPNLNFLRRFLPASIKNSDLIVTISESTKKDVVSRYARPAKTISVITPAVDHSRFKPQGQKTVETVLRKLNIRKPYILSVGTIEPRKNLTGVLNAFDLLPEEIKKSYALVLAGGKGWSDDEINQKYEKLSNRYTVVKTGYIEDEDLPALYTGASVFVFPSFYEGFGIPPLEAMACGAPTITSDNSSLPEAVGSAAITVKAEDTKNLSRQIEKVLVDKKLAESLRAKGVVQAKKFTWERSAQKLFSAIDGLS